MSSRIAYQLRTVAWWLREISEAYHNQVKGIIQRYGKKSFLADPLIQDAVIRNLEVIGEASWRVYGIY